MRPGRTSRALGVLITLIGVAASAACQPRPEFYLPPETLPADPGDIVRTTVVDFDDNTPGIWSRAVMYRSTTATGEPNVVTGTVLVPESPWPGPGPRPIVSFAPGTQGLGDRCAPSRTLASGSNYETSVVAQLLAQGWAVTVTDYEKMGPPGNPTYLVKAAGAHAVLDIVRAAQRLPGAGLDPTAPVALWGYSQGGQAAGGAAEIEATYAPELEIVGVVAGGVPADGAAVAANLDGDGPGNEYFSFLAFTAVGYDSAYPELDLASFLNDEGRRLLDLGLSGGGVCLADGVDLLRGRHIAELTTTDPLDTPQWQARMAEQDLGGVAPAVPVLQYHGTSDQVIPLAVGTALRDDWCAGGALVTFQEFPADHITGVFVGAASGVAFLTERFAGEPAGSTCPA